MSELYKENKITRGFVTVATGNDFYYKCARTLLRSYRLTNSKYPFAIICDRENEYTKEFDDVVILDNPQNNYLDKLRVLIDSPYDETFFIETDCIVYNNIECFFDLLAKEYDFSAFGWNDGDLSTWFKDTQLVVERFGEKASSIHIFNPGYLFIRKTKVTAKIYNDAIDIGRWITENNIKGGKISLFCKGTLRDDQLFAMSMKINDCYCCEEPTQGKCVFLPNTKRIIRISLLNHKLDAFYCDRILEDCNILHFSSRRCREEGLYLQQSIVVNMLTKSVPRWLVRLVEARVVYYFFHIFRKIKYKLIHIFKREK